MPSLFDDFDARVLRVFARGEACDSVGFAEIFAQAPVYQFGNAAPCLDRPAIRASVASFFGLVEALYHDIKTVQTVGDTAFVEMDVHYWRKVGGSVVLPCLDVFRFAADGAVAELRIGMDAGPVADPRLDTSHVGSMFSGANGSALARRDPMRKFFADHPEGRARIASGYAPKWSLSGPRWNLLPVNAQ